MRLVGVIQQNPHIFNQSLRENLLIGKGNATDDELWDALERVGLRPRAEQLPNGLDTVIDESGKSFSGGERHRIALARILLSKPAIVILDEPFAGLARNRASALETMLSALEGSTVPPSLIIFKAFRARPRAVLRKRQHCHGRVSAELEQATNAIERCSPSTAATLAPSSSHEAK
ncbi:MAG: ATP-binding cassette domain-containing protein [Eggerthellaceae bacterium]